MSWLTVPPLLIYLLLGLVLVIIIAQFLILRGQSRAGDMLKARMREVRDLEAALLETQGLLAQVREEVHDLQQRLTRPLSAAAAPLPQQPYARAIELIRQGYGPEALMEACELSRGEAELLLTMHRPSAPAP